MESFYSCRAVNKKNYMLRKTKVIIFGFLFVSSLCVAQTTPLSQMEKLDRGLVVIPNYSGSGNFVSWRFLGTDSDNTSFDVLRDGKVICSDIDDRTNYSDVAGTPLSKYQIVTRKNGKKIDVTDAVVSWGEVCKKIRIDFPPVVKGPDKVDYKYIAGDCSVGDVDGDMEYEIIVKVEPTNQHDNSHNGYTGNVYLDCYKMDGKRMWRIDFGKNIRAGAHYNQVLVYDFDGDGRSEIISKTAPDTKDGAGRYVSLASDLDEIRRVDNGEDLRNANGKITRGHEYLTVFDGETGKAVHTVFYNPNRAFGLGGGPEFGDWGTPNRPDMNYANRGDRYLACVAYLGGPDKNPSAVMCRGYYTKAYLWAVDFDGKRLSTRWLHASVSETDVELTDGEGNKTFRKYTKNTRPDNEGSKTMYGNGNHNLSVGDVDGDGCDEILYGAAALDNDGNLLYATGYGHGDRMHFSDLMPDRPGLEVFDVHEAAPYGWDIHDAATGEILISATGPGDNGRGVAADVIPESRGFEFWSANDRRIRSAVTGEVLSPVKPSYDFRLYWNGDLYEETFEKADLQTWNGTGLVSLYPREGKRFADYAIRTGGTKLTADIIGDWREEIILRDEDGLVVFTTNLESPYRVPTLMHDHIYRMGVAWQNIAYNQPPHLGYYLPDSLVGKK